MAGEIPFFLKTDKIVNPLSLKNSFIATITDLNPDVNSQRATIAGQKFIDDYSESHRYYHNLNHIQHLVRLANHFRSLLKDPAAVQATIWGHDVVYKPGAGDNEEESAKVTTDLLDGLGVPKDKLAKINSYIIATKDHKNPTGDSDLDYLLDMDMLSLAAPWETYYKAAENIRREFGQPDEVRIKSVQLEFLRETLKSPIFKTPTFAPLETQARTNMNRLIALLGTNPTT